MPKELPETEYSAVRPVTGWGRATLCFTHVTFFSCSPESTDATVRELLSWSSRLP